MNKGAARSQVTLAIKHGRLERLPYEACGAIPTEAHHPDYSQPLNVRWLCREHHARLHYFERIGRNGEDALMPGTAHAYALGRLEAFAQVAESLNAMVFKMRDARDEAIRDALDEGVSVSRIAKALGISRQATDDVVKRVRRG